jgi:hypothetical protein
MITQIKQENAPKLPEDVGSFLGDLLLIADWVVERQSHLDVSSVRAAEAMTDHATGTWKAAN